MDQVVRVARNRDDRQSSIYRLGETVNLMIRDAMIIEIDQDVLCLETGDGQQVAIVPGANVAIQHIHPTGGPIEVCGKPVDDPIHHLGEDIEGGDDRG